MAAGEPDESNREAVSWSRLRLERLRPHVFALAVLVGFATMAWAHRWLHEDGLINLRVIQNLLAGRGPVYNAGERVEAFTSPAQVAIVSLASIVTLGQVPLDALVLLVGVALSVSGLWLAMRGAVHLWGLGERGRSLLPVGALAFAAVPLSWDFATSGHEGSVGYAWIGAAAYVLGRRVAALRSGTEVRIDRGRWELVVLGSGALVRPEYALFTVSFVVAWAVLHRGAAGARWSAAAWAFGPTVAYQVFRMGYFALVVPNTALAKLGGPFGASEGWYYLRAFVGPFWLWVGLGAVAVLLGRRLASASSDQRVAVAALVVPALLTIGYLVSIGGDYVNGRLLVVPFFALLAPVSLLDGSDFVDRSGGLRWVPAGLGAVLVLWATLTATSLRPPWDAKGNDFLDVRYDARELAIQRWVGEPPTTIEDYRDTFLAGPIKTLATQLPSTDGGILVLDDPYYGQVVLLPAEDGPVIASTTIGALGTVGGIDVRIIDRLALADPIASHLPVTGTTAGHLRKLSNAWVYGRLGIEADPASAAAVRALSCGDLQRLLDDTTGPMGPGRFLSNILHAPGNTTISIPGDPEEAVDAFC